MPGKPKRGREKKKKGSGGDQNDDSRKNKGGRDNKGKGDGGLDKDLCSLVTVDTSKMDKSKEYMTFSLAQDWYTRFLRVFDERRLTDLRDRAKDANAPLGAQTLIGNALALVPIMTSKLAAVQSRVKSLKFEQEVEKDVFTDCDNIRSVIDERDDERHRSLLASRKLCYRVQQLHYLLMANHETLRKQAYTYLVKDRGYVNPEVDPLFRRLEFSYNSTKFYATYGGIEDCVVVFKISKPSEQDARFEIDDRVIKAGDISEPTVVLINATPEEVRNVIFDSLPLTRRSQTVNRSRTRLFDRS
jgi:hypothetical protein